MVPLPRLEDVEIPSANLRTPYMYDSAQERWAGDSEILKMDGFCVCALVSIWVCLKIIQILGYPNVSSTLMVGSSSEHLGTSLIEIKVVNAR